MGNTVSAAEIAATQIVHPNTLSVGKHAHYAKSDFNGNIPPECPMHKKASASECPVNQDGDINPLNMVGLV